MKLKVIFYFSLISFSFSEQILNHISESQDTRNTANAVNQIIRDFYIKSKISFNILFVKNLKSSYELLENILMQNKVNFSISINHFDNYLPKFINLTNF